MVGKLLSKQPRISILSLNMDYFVGFLAGYYWYKFVKYLRKIVDNKIVFEHEWDWFYSDDK